MIDKISPIVNYGLGTISQAHSKESYKLCILIMLLWKIFPESSIAGKLKLLSFGGKLNLIKFVFWVCRSIQFIALQSRRLPFKDWSNLWRDFYGALKATRNFNEWNGMWYVRQLKMAGLVVGGCSILETDTTLSLCWGYELFYSSQIYRKIKKHKNFRKTNCNELF